MFLARSGVVSGKWDGVLWAFCVNTASCVVEIFWSVECQEGRMSTRSQDGDCKSCIATGRRRMMLLRRDNGQPMYLHELPQSPPALPFR